MCVYVGGVGKGGGEGGNKRGGRIKECRACEMKRCLRSSRVWPKRGCDQTSSSFGGVEAVTKRPSLKLLRPSGFCGTVSSSQTVRCVVQLGTWCSESRAAHRNVRISRAFSKAGCRRKKDQAIVFVLLLLSVRKHGNELNSCRSGKVQDYMH